MASPAVAYARENQQRFLNELKDLLRIPSVSTTPEHKGDVQRAAEFVANELRRIGMENVEVIRGKGHPLIYADWLHAVEKPTVLCYAHYDVQPPDPLDEWISPPFEPVERNNNIYARGAVDDKGQLWLELKAVESLMRGHGGTLPINVKFIFEGEEEVGGESIADYIRKQKGKLKRTSLWSATQSFLLLIFPPCAWGCGDSSTPRLRRSVRKQICTRGCTVAPPLIRSSRLFKSSAG
jgi:acetylornithine deacetylase/succinyl-diaminopimelate desuccinylase-like protein